MSKARTSKSQRQVALKRWMLKPGSPRGFGYLGLRLRLVSQIPRSAALVIVKLTYFGNAALHREAGLLSIRLCLQTLRCKANAGEFALGSVLLAFAAATPQLVASHVGLPGHSGDEWPGNCLIGMASLDDQKSPFEYEVDEKYASRADAHLYTKNDPAGPDVFSNYRLTCEADRWHPFRGAGTRSRISEFTATQAFIVKKQRASGLSMNAWIDTNHRRKTICGSVRLSRHFAVSLKPLLQPALSAGPLRSVLSRREKARGGRPAYPFSVSPTSCPQAYRQALALFSAVRAQGHK